MAACYVPVRLIPAPCGGLCPRTPRLFSCAPGQAFAVGARPHHAHDSQATVAEVSQATVTRASQAIVTGDSQATVADVAADDLQATAAADSQATMCVSDVAAEDSRATVAKDSLAKAAGGVAKDALDSHVTMAGVSLPSSSTQRRSRSRSPSSRGSSPILRGRCYRLWCTRSFGWFPQFARFSECTQSRAWREGS